VVDVALAGLMTVIFAYALYEMQDFAPDSRLLPSLAIIPGLAFSVVVLGARVRHFVRADEEPPPLPFTEPRFLVALLAYAGLIWAVGFDIATVVLIAWMLFGCAKMRLVTGTVYGVAIFAAIHGLLVLMKLEAPTGVLLDIV
jgi:hypothetical protein